MTTMKFLRLNVNNDYKCYSVHLKRIDEVPIYHYLFQKMIVHAWTEKNYYSEYKEEDPQGTGSVSYTSTIKNHDFPKISRLSNTSLMPITGSLSID